jgi:adenine phosphoribosyltransferase
MPALAETVRAAIRTIPDYPKPGILFRDVTTLVGDPVAFKTAITLLAEPWRKAPPDKVAGLEARGFIIGGALAATLEVGFIPVRKPGKLPARTLRADYTLEYGSDSLEIHADAARRGERVLLVDDLIATGGTAQAALQLLTLLGVDVVGAAFVVDLPDLGGSARLSSNGTQVQSVVSFSGH